MAVARLREALSFSEIARRTPTLSFIPSISDVWACVDAECRDGLAMNSALAWAAGFFVGEGSVGCRIPMRTPAYAQLTASITQAGTEGVPDVLE